MHNTLFLTVTITNGHIDSSQKRAQHTNNTSDILSRFFNIKIIDAEYLCQPDTQEKKRQRRLIETEAQVRLFNGIVMVTVLTMLNY